MRNQNFILKEPDEPPDDELIIKGVYFNPHGPPEELLNSKQENDN